jgi:hypothetical protein
MLSNQTLFFPLPVVVPRLRQCKQTFHLIPFKILHPVCTLHENLCELLARGKLQGHVIVASSLTSTFHESNRIFITHFFSTYASFSGVLSLISTHPI